ncbi:MAG: NirD/YgiW/YdeI family stress tolerance protein [Oxalobacter formigenes]|nr:NirD/YgiW/YdeI family stress tolerance protein [Oxalobacter formigenes]
MKASQKIMAVIGIALAAGLFGQAQAQYTGPGQNTAAAITTVAGIMKNAADDQEVTLRGRITKKLKKEHYEFQDNTGTVRMEIDDKHFHNIRVTDKTLVEVYGEVEKDFARPLEIDVKRLTVIKP